MFLLTINSWLPTVDWTVVSCYLPAWGILPIEVEPVKVVLLDEADHVVHELPPGRRIVDQPAVLVALGVVPAADGDRHLDAVPLQGSYFQIKFCKKKIVHLKYFFQTTFHVDKS